MIIRKKYLVTCLFPVLYWIAASSAAYGADSAAMQAILQKCYDGKGPCALSFQGSKRVLDTPLLIVPSLVTLRDVTIQCTMASGPCLNVTMDGYESTFPAGGTHALENITLIGNGNNDGIRMSYNGNNPNIDAVIALNHVGMIGFAHGLVLGSGTWGGNFQDVQIGDGNIGIYVPANIHNAGERTTYNGTIYNNQVGIDEESSYEFDFNGVSFDFNATQMILNGPTNFIGHIENQTTANPEIYLKALTGVPAGSIYMSAGSTITVDGNTPGQPAGECYVSTVVYYNNIQVPATTWGFVGKSGNPVCGPGTTYSFGSKVPPSSLNY